MKRLYFLLALVMIFAGATDINAQKSEQFAAQKVEGGKADPQTQQIVYKALNAYAY